MTVATVTICGVVCSRHIICEGARYHVLYYSYEYNRRGNGRMFRHCTEKDCEVNRETELEREEFNK